MPRPMGKPGEVVLTDLAADHSFEELVDYLAEPNPPIPSLRRGHGGMLPAGVLPTGNLLVRPG